MHGRYFDLGIIQTHRCSTSLYAHVTINLLGASCLRLCFVSCYCYIHYLKGYISVPSNSSGYGNIECNGNETKLEECTVRKDVHETCHRAAVVSHCSNGKICVVTDTDVK